MLGDLITSSLILVFGYAYPAFECFKTVEKKRVNNEELRFWCQYWIIVAIITVFERIGDIFLSWLPMYGEAKLALFIYLWYPKTKGCGYVFETILRPYVANHETDIERSLLEFRARAMELAIYYWQNCTELGQTKFFEVLHYLASKSANVITPISEKAEIQRPAPSAPPLPPESAWPPVPSPSPTSRRAVGQSPRAQTVQVRLENKTGFVHVEDTATILDEVSGPNPIDPAHQNGSERWTMDYLRPGSDYAPKHPKILKNKHQLVFKKES